MISKVTPVIRYQMCVCDSGYHMCDTQYRVTRHCFECHTWYPESRVIVLSVKHVTISCVHLSLWLVVSSVTCPLTECHVCAVRRQRSWTWMARVVAPSSEYCSTLSWPTTPPSCQAPSSFSSATSVRDRRCYKPSHRYDISLSYHVSHITYRCCRSACRCDTQVGVMSYVIYHIQVLHVVTRVWLKSLSCVTCHLQVLHVSYPVQVLQIFTQRWHKLDVVSLTVASGCLAGRHKSVM